MSDLKIKIVSASYHRNGVCGAGFYAIIFDEATEGRMIASLFDERGYCAVYTIDGLSKGNIAFAQGNSWRGDHFEDVLRPLLKKYLKSQGSNRLRPFSLPQSTL